MERRQHRLDPQGVGDLAADLSRRAAERHQGMAARVEAAFGGDAPDRLGHLLDGDGDKAFGGGLRRRQAHRLGQGLQRRARGGGVERLVAVGSEGRGEIGRVDAAQHQVGVGHRRRAAATVAGWTRIGAGAARADARAGAVEGQDRAAARSDGLDIEHRRAQPGAGQRRALAPLQDPGETADIGRGAAHVEAQHGRRIGLDGRGRHSDRPAGGAGQHRVPALKAVGAHQAAGRGHEPQRRAVHRGLHPVDIGAQDRRQIGVRHGRLGARQEAGQGRDLATEAHVRKPGGAGQLPGAPLVRGVQVAVQETDRRRREPLGHGPGQTGRQGRLFGCGDDRAVGGQALVRLQHPGVQRRGARDVEGEEVRPRLVADG